MKTKWFFILAYVILFVVGNLEVFAKGICWCAESSQEDYHPCLSNPLECAGYCSDEYNNPSHQFSPENCKDICHNLPGKEKFKLLSCQKKTFIGMFGKKYNYLSVNIECTADNHRKGQCWSLACWQSGKTCNISFYELLNGLSQWDVGKHCSERGARSNLKCPR